MQSLLYTLLRLIVCLDRSDSYPDVRLAGPSQSHECRPGARCYNKLLTTRLCELPQLGPGNEYSRNKEKGEQSRSALPFIKAITFT